MKTKIEIEGLESLNAELSNLSDDSDDVIANTINDLLFGTQARAVMGIQRGPASGRVYEKYNPRRTHQASAPGQYPMSDTGRLASAIAIEPATRAALLGTVGTSVMHGRDLEFGTSKMLPRPWLLPSFEAERVEVEDKLKREWEARL